MARLVRRGEIWFYTFKHPDKQRPVLILTRQEVIELLHTVMVAPVTSTIRCAPSEVIIGIDEGLKNASVVNMDHVQTVEKSRLHRRVGTVGSEKMKAVCHALSITTGCS